MRLFETANYSLIPNRKKGYITSGILLALSVISLGTFGLELGIDFRGGMEFIVTSDTELNVTEVRNELDAVLGSTPEVKTFDDDILVRTLDEGEISIVQAQVVDGINAAFPGSNAQVVGTDIVGPRFAEELALGAIYSILGSLLVILVYIWIRFEWRFGIGAIAALAHDVTITLGIFSILKGLDIVPFSLQIDQTIIAAFLTIVGYSLNDTVVIFDRIREYTNIFKTEAYSAVVNKSINNTLSRTVVTSLTTLLVVTTLFILGGEVLRGFAFALIIGVMIGTYSSIWVASPIVVELRQRAAK
ncbi:MAG: protein translocase subunit SecF [Bacteroidota bacterium]